MTKTQQPFKVENSKIHGFGAFASRKIRKGERIIEYVGERVSSKEADARYENAPPDSIVLLFVVDAKTTVDAGVGGNDARFINHSCDPNCDPEIERGHIYIDAIKDIYPGEELTYDYNLTREGRDGPDVETEYACHCGSANCRGSMLEPLRARTKRKRKPAKTKKAKK